MTQTQSTKTPAQLVEAYIKLRDKKKAAQDEFKKSLETTNQIMEQLEGMLLTMLADSGGDSFSCPAGTVYRNTENSATVQDKPAFRAWVEETGSWDAVDLRANKVAIRQLLEAGETVPGVKFTSVHTVGIRRS